MDSRCCATRPIVFGLFYGIAAYLVMNLVVLPLSAAGKPTFVLPLSSNGVLIHMFGVGRAELPCRAGGIRTFRAVDGSLPAHAVAECASSNVRS